MEDIEPLKLLEDDAVLEFDFSDFKLYFIAIVLLAIYSFVVAGWAGLSIIILSKYVTHNILANIVANKKDKNGNKRT